MNASRSSLTVSGQVLAYNSKLSVLNCFYLSLTQGNIFYFLTNYSSRNILNV